MKQTSSIPRRTALAIAAASAGLTLAVTAMVASSLGLIAPAAPGSAPSTGQEQPIQQPPLPITSDALASVPADSASQPPASEMTRASTRGEDGRSARRKHDDDDDDDRRDEKLRRSPTNGAAVGWSASQVLRRDHHDDDDD